MVEHSETYLRRRNNPRGFVKTEWEHIQTFLSRVKEHFDLDITEEEYRDILKRLPREGKHLYHIGSDISLFSFEYKSVKMWIIYGRASKFGDPLKSLPPRMKTALIPLKQFPIPHSLENKYNHYTFTSRVREVVKEIISYAPLLDLDNKKTFFMRTDIPAQIKVGTLKYKEGYDEETVALVAAKYVIRTETEPKNEDLADVL